MVNAILTGRFIRKTFVEHRRELIEKSQYGKQIDDFVDLKNMENVPRPPIFLGLESEKSENQVICFENFEK